MPGYLRNGEIESEQARHIVPGESDWPGRGRRFTEGLRGVCVGSKGQQQLRRPRSADVG